MMPTMDSATALSPDRLAQTLDWVERHLDERLTLEQIASAAGWSPYHFSRLFSARMGVSVMAHVRGRRLVRGARRLLEEPTLKLVDLAFDCGFESQEAFTRAFRRTFGVSPGRFRRGFAVTPIKGQFPTNVPELDSSAVVQLPGLVTLEGLRVAGPTRRFDSATKAEIPQLWSALVGSLPFVGQFESWATYGVVWGADREEGTFAYMAGVGVDAACVPPAGFETIQIPRGRYLVFRITLNGAAVHPQVKNAMATIWGELIPASGYEIADSPDFERYDSEFAPTRPGAVIDFHVPVMP
jgi:AraC family transcriptional regulator